MRIELGARLDSAPGPKYRSSLRFCELDLRGGLPKPAKLREWVNPDEQATFSISLVAPDELVFDGQGRPHAKHERSVFDRLASACEALSAHCLVLETGARLSPSLRDRQRLQNYCETLKSTPGCPQLVWRAGGLWEPEEAVAFCAQHELWPALDPFADELPELAHLYLQARAEGGTQRFGEDHFVRLIQKLEAHEHLQEVFITLDSERSFREVGRLKGLLEEFGLLEPSDSSADES